MAAGGIKVLEPITAQVTTDANCGVFTVFATVRLQRFMLLVDNYIQIVCTVV